MARKPKKPDATKPVNTTVRDNTDGWSELLAISSIDSRTLASYLRGDKEKQVVFAIYSVNPGEKLSITTIAGKTGMKPEEVRSVVGEILARNKDYKSSAIKSKPQAIIERTRRKRHERRADPPAPAEAQADAIEPEQVHTRPAYPVTVRDAVIAGSGNVAMPREYAPISDLGNVKYAEYNSMSGAKQIVIDAVIGMEPGTATIESVADATGLTTEQVDGVNRNIQTHFPKRFIGLVAGKASTTTTTGRHM